MPDTREYIAVNSATLLAKRSFVRYSTMPSGSHETNGSRIVIPFSGFDGQKLAGTGALVWEGETIESIH